MDQGLELRRAIRACTLCPLHTLASGPVPPTFPVVWREPRILILGEAPGRSEDRLLAPFVGPSGAWLRQTLLEAQIDPSTVAIANAVCCWPKRDPVTPTAEEIVACSTNLAQTLAYTRARYILALGNIALSALHPDPNTRVSEWRGKWWQSERGGDALIMSTYHPSYVLRNRYGNVGKIAKADIYTFTFYSLSHFMPELERVESQITPTRKVVWR